LIIPPLTLNQHGFYSPQLAAIKSTRTFRRYTPPHGAGSVDDLRENGSQEICNIDGVPHYTRVFKRTGRGLNALNRQVSEPYASEDPKKRTFMIFRKKT
jgi:hypothetical protein